MRLNEYKKELQTINKDVKVVKVGSKGRHYKYYNITINGEVIADFYTYKYEVVEEYSLGAVYASVMIVETNEELSTRLSNEILNGTITLDEALTTYNALMN